MNDPFEAYRKSKSYSFIDSRIGECEKLGGVRSLKGASTKTTE